MQPPIEGDGEAGFGSLDEVLGDILIENLAQQPLALSVADFEVEGNAPGKFDEARVEEGNAGFETDPHTGAIEFHENVVGEVGDGVQVHHGFGEVGECRPGLAIA